MNNFPSKETVERIRRQYPKGGYVTLVRMGDPHSRLKPGDEGIVSCVDDSVTIFMNWNNGEGLGVVFGEDSCRIIKESSHGH